MGNRKIGINTSFSIDPTVLHTIDGLKNSVIEAAYQKALREINLKALGNVKCEMPKVITFDEDDL